MILNNAHYQATNVWDVRNLKNVTRRKKMKQITNEQAIQYIIYLREDLKNSVDETILQALDLAINCTGAIEQIKWERDIAIQQLNKLGYQFGEKIRPMNAEDFNKALISDELKTECEKADKLFKADKE